MCSSPSTRWQESTLTILPERASAPVSGTRRPASARYPAGMQHPPQWGPGYGYGYGPPPPKKTPAWHYILYVVGGLVGLLFIIGIASKDTKSPKTRASTSASVSASAAPAPMTSAEATAAWPAALKDANDSIASADKLNAQGKPLDADDALELTEKDLHSRFDPTPIASAKDFVDVMKKIADKRKLLAPRAGPLRTAREKQDAADKAQEEKDEKARGETPTVSAWDGSVYAVERYLKPRMHDPDSLEMAGCTRPVSVEAYWITNCDYRGSNAFGAKVLNSGRFFIQRDEVVKVEGASP